MMQRNMDNVYQRLIESSDLGEKAVLVTLIGEFAIQKMLLTESELYPSDLPAVAEQLDTQFPGLPGVGDLARKAIGDGMIQIMPLSPDKQLFIEPFYPEPKLIVFGGGHISLTLVEFAAKAGFSVTVVDDRPAFANPGRFPLAERVLCEDFMKSFDDLKFHRSTFVVIVTRGHRHDQRCLQETLSRETGYVGMIGSRRRLGIVFDQLREIGYSAEQLESVHAPVGLSINAVTPPEIAVSILAELISVRRKRDGDKSSADPSRRFMALEYDRAVIQKLAAGHSEPCVLVSVLATRGSVPRKAGAKMLVFADGQIAGSIGGGCSEGNVIISARDLLRHGGYRTETIDLTGEAAEDEGMVCGGIMDVLLEYIEGLSVEDGAINTGV